MFACGFSCCPTGESYGEGLSLDGNDFMPDRYQGQPAPTGCSPLACGCLPGMTAQCFCSTTPEGGILQACNAI